MSKRAHWGLKVSAFAAIILLAVSSTQAMTINNQPGYSVTWTGTQGEHKGFPVPSNLAKDVGTPFASSQFGFNHLTSKLNDGWYGNLDSWIANDADTAPHAGIALNDLYFVNSIAWGRDNRPVDHGPYTDRSIGDYTIQVTQAANPATALDGEWTSVAVVTYSDLWDGRWLRHEYDLELAGGGMVQATGVRLLIATNDPAGGIAIDEIEIYGSLVPEPGSLALLGMGGLLLFRRKRA